MSNMSETSFTCIDERAHSLQFDVCYKHTVILHTHQRRRDQDQDQDHGLYIQVDSEESPLEIF